MILKGAAGLIKSIVNGDAELAIKRLEICKKCDLATIKNEKPIFCGHPWYKLLKRKVEEDGCGCWLESKARVKDEVCPRNRWGKNE